MRSFRNRAVMVAVGVTINVSSSILLSTCVGAANCPSNFAVAFSKSCSRVIVFNVRGLSRISCIYFLRITAADLVLPAKFNQKIGDCAFSQSSMFRAPQFRYPCLLVLGDAKTQSTDADGFGRLFGTAATFIGTR